MLAGKPALGRRGARRLAHKVRQAREIVLGFELERIGLLVSENVLAERGAKGRQPLADLSQSLARLGIERRAGALEHQIIALQNARLLGREAECVAALPERVDAAEQRLVEQDAVPVASLARRNLALDREQRIVGVGAGKHAKDPADPIERATRAFHRLNGVLERSGRRITGDCGNLGLMLGEGAVEGRHEMLGRDAAKGRNGERASPVLKQGIVGRRALIGHRRYLGWLPGPRKLAGRAPRRKNRSKDDCSVIAGAPDRPEQHLGEAKIGVPQSRNTTKKSMCTRTSRSEASYPPTTG